MNYHLQTLNTPEYSPVIPLGSRQADAAGAVDTTVRLPPAAPGIHTLELEGEAAGGVAVTKAVLLRYPGRPTGGDTLTTYLCCFEPEPDEIPFDFKEELVDVFYQGMLVTTMIPDEDGALLVELPLVDPMADPQGVEIEAVSRLTGRSITEEVTPAPERGRAVGD